MLSDLFFIGAKSSTKSADHGLNLKIAGAPALRTGLGLLMVVFLIGCNGGAAGGGGGEVFTGVFVDEAVEGLPYATPSHNGITGAGGTFNYMAGETVRFFMGDVTLGQGSAKEVMMPVDLVPGAVDEMHPAVTNIGRMLQTMDEDGDPDNGIHIPGDAVDMMTGRSMDFNMHPDNFDQEYDVIAFMADLNMVGPHYSGREMVSAQDARDHMRNTMMDMMGTGTAPKAGSFFDSEVEGLFYETDTQSGYTDAHGSFSFVEGEDIRFFIGSVMLGEAPAQEIMTPVDLVPGAFDESHPTVTNMARFLQTMDHNNNPDDGILIPASVDAEMTNRQIDFEMTTENFENHGDVTMLLDTMATMDPAYVDRMLVSVGSAQAHMRQTLADIMTLPDNMMDDAQNARGMLREEGPMANGMGGNMGGM